LQFETLENMTEEQEQYLLRKTLEHKVSLPKILKEASLIGELTRSLELPARQENADEQVESAELPI